MLAYASALDDVLAGAADFALVDVLVSVPVLAAASAPGYAVGSAPECAAVSVREHAEDFVVSAVLDASDWSDSKKGKNDLCLGIAPTEVFVMAVE